MERPPIKSIVRDATSFIFLILIIVQTFALTVQHGMRERVPQVVPHYIRAISCAVSSLQYGVHGYAGHTTILETLANGFAGNLNQNEQVLNRTIAQTLQDGRGSRPRFSLELTREWSFLDNLESDAIHGMAENDIGFVDFARFSFSIFGYRISSFLYFYFFLLSLQSLLFFVQFRQYHSAMTFLILYLLGHYMGVVHCSMIIALQSVWNTRFLPVIGILPVIHVCLLASLKVPMRPRPVVIAIVQSAMFLLILRTRGSLVWAVFFLSITLALGIATSWMKKSARPCAARLMQLKVSRWFVDLNESRVWPLVLILSIVIFAKGLSPFLLNPVYSHGGSNVSGHVFWHAVFCGMALRPEINETAGHLADYRTQKQVHKGLATGGQVRLRHRRSRGQKFVDWLLGFHNRYLHSVLYEPDDQDSYSAAFKWERDHNAPETNLFLFSHDEDVNYQKLFRWFGQEVKSGREFDIRKDFNFKKYENVLSRVCSQVAWEHPIQMLELFLIIKPLRFFHYYYVYVEIISQRIHSLSGNSKFDPTSLITNLLLASSFIYACGLACRAPLNRLRKIAGMLLSLFFCSMIPSIAVYSASHVIADAALVLTTALAFFVACVLQAPVRWFNHIRQRQRC